MEKIADILIDPVDEASWLSADLPDGYFCHCHGSKFDLVDRVSKNIPVPTNLVVPSYSFLSDAKVLIGVDTDRMGQAVAA